MFSLVLLTDEGIIVSANNSGVSTAFVFSRNGSNPEIRYSIGNPETVNLKDAEGKPIPLVNTVQEKGTIPATGNGGNAFAASRILPLLEQLIYAKGGAQSAEPKGRWGNGKN